MEEKEVISLIKPIYTMEKNNDITQEQREMLEKFYESDSHKEYVNKISSYNKAVLRSFRQHILEGRKAGSFVEAVLHNNFVGACLKADYHMKRCLPEIATYMQQMPTQATGGEDRVGSWRARGGLISAYDGEVENAIDYLKDKGL